MIFMEGGSILEEGTVSDILEAPKSDRLKLFLRRHLADGGKVAGGLPGHLEGVSMTAAEANPIVARPTSLPGIQPYEPSERWEIHEAGPVVLKRRNDGICTC